MVKEKKRKEDKERKKKERLKAGDNVSRKRMIKRNKEKEKKNYRIPHL